MIRKGDIPDYNLHPEDEEETERWEQNKKWREEQAIEDYFLNKSLGRII